MDAARGSPAANVSWMHQQVKDKAKPLANVLSWMQMDHLSKVPQTESCQGASINSWKTKVAKFQSRD